MEILTSIVGKITEYTVEPIVRQANHLIFYKDNFKILKDCVKDLEDARERIIHKVKSETRNGKVIEKDVTDWLVKVNEVIEKANGLQNDPRNANVRCSAPNLILRHQLSRKATKITNDVVQVQRQESFDQIGYLPPPDVVASFPTRADEKYDTRELLKEDIVKALADLNSHNIGVYGLGGVGKTTLVKKVAETAHKHKLFDNVVITEVSKDPDIRRIQEEIADFMGLRFQEQTILGRAQRLRQRIKMEKSILIILDNIWTILDLKRVGIPFGNEHNGCKLLMTSRDQEVLLQMDVPKEFTYKVELMSENETSDHEISTFFEANLHNPTDFDSSHKEEQKKRKSMEILTSIVGKIVRQANHLTFYKGNFKMLKDSVEHLEAARERIIHKVESETRNGKVIEKDVTDWLVKVNEVIEKANGLQNDPRNANVRCSAWSFPSLILRHQLSRKATKITNDVVQVQRQESFDQIGYLPPLDVVATFPTGADEKYDTRELLKEDIVKALADLNSHNIGVYGLGGVGKTTLVEKVAETAHKHKLFDNVVITEVSKDPDIRRIQGEIADFMGLRFQEQTILGRAQRLRQRIKMEKSILIILDNIWTILDLKEVGIPFGNEHNGCKLLMTCRNQEVLLQMDVPKDYTYKVELMSENETWSLFQFMAGDVVKDSNLKDVPFQVAQKCAGLPLRVVTVARAMKNKRDVESWKDALRKLQSNDHTEMELGTYSALELSYNSLESDEMRALFLLFALLPGDIEHFLKVAMGLDILKHVNAIDYARNRLYIIIKSLEARCLLLEVKTDRNIQMHDFVRDFAISIARRDKHVLLREQSDEEWPTNDFLKRCTQIVLDRCRMHELPQTIYCPNINFFFLYNMNRSLEIPDTFFEGMRSLRVLDLIHMNLLSLPTSFRLLTDLQTLCLDQCILENMGALEALQNLQILSLCKSSMIKLPREIGRLIQLRMLDLSHSGIEVVPPNIISSLTKLEELYMGNTSICWEDVNSTVQNENASLAELRKLPNLTALELQIRETWMLPRDLQLVFEKLERYKIAIGDVWDWSDIMHKPLKTLMLKLGTNIHLEHGIKLLIKGVENLYLDDVDGIQNVLYQLNGEGFPFLKHLHIQNNANLKQIVDSKERNQIHVSFPILETLVLLNLQNLEHIFHGRPSIASFGKLSVIKVKNCVQLKYIFSYAVVKELSHISKIEVCECNSMKEVVFRDNKSSANNDITDEKIEFLQLRSLTLEHLETLDNFASDYLSHLRSKEKYQGLEPYASPTPFFNAQAAFPNLDTLKLSSLINLNKVWDDNHQSMCNLTSLIMDNCVGLKYLFPSTLVESFMNLKHLEISNCSLMEEIITKDERNNALEEVHFLKLEKVILKDMDNLKSIWHYQFKTLKMLEVNNCKKIVVVFPSSMQNTYNELEKLEVTNCDLVEEIFELTFNENNSLEDTSHLIEVNVVGLLNLKKIWSRDPEGILSFQAINYVIVNDCPSLEYLLPLSVATRCSHLRVLGIKNCENMEEIFAEEKLGIKNCENMQEIVAEEKESSMNAAPIFEFNQLTTLFLWHLPKLNGFYAGNYTLLCPSLTINSVFECPKLNLFINPGARNM